MDHFNKFLTEDENPLSSKSGCKLAHSNIKIPSISQHSVFEYYTKHSILSSSNGFQPCPITKTPFRDTDTFLKFIKYLTTSSKLETDSEKEATIELSAAKMENPPQFSQIIFSVF